MAYRVFHRTWWKENPSWPNGLEPEPGMETDIDIVDTEVEARKMCAEWNSRHNPGRLSRRAEYKTCRGG